MGKRECGRLSLPEVFVFCANVISTAFELVPTITALSAVFRHWPSTWTFPGMENRVRDERGNVRERGESGAYRPGQR